MFGPNETIDGYISLWQEQGEAPLEAVEQIYTGDLVLIDGRLVTRRAAAKREGLLLAVALGNISAGSGCRFTTGEPEPFTIQDWDERTRHKP